MSCDPWRWSCKVLQLPVTVRRLRNKLMSMGLLVKLREGGFSSNHINAMWCSRQYKVQKYEHSKSFPQIVWLIWQYRKLLTFLKHEGILERNETVICNSESNYIVMSLKDIYWVLLLRVCKCFACLVSILCAGCAANRQTWSLLQRQNNTQHFWRTASVDI